MRFRFGKRAREYALRDAEMARLQHDFEEWGRQIEACRKEVQGTVPASAPEAQETPVAECQYDMCGWRAGLDGMSCPDDCHVAVYKVKHGVRS